MAKRKSTVDAYTELIQELKKKIYKPIYFLTGDEPYYIDKISDFIAANVLEESEKAFNQTILYGKDVDVPAIINASRRFPMMANHQVIIVKEAQNIKKLEELEIYLKTPLKSTILVICNKPKSDGKPRSNEKLRKVLNQIEKMGVLFESKKLYDSQIPDWIINYLAGKNCTIAPIPAKLLTEYLGNDLSKIENELEKLFITLPPNSNKITVEHIEQFIGVSKDYNRFELTKAIGERNILKANKVVDYFAKNPGPNPFTLSITSIYQYFIKVFKIHFITDKSNPNLASELGVNIYFVEEYKNAAKIYSYGKCVQIFSLLREYDLRSKGLNNTTTDNGELLKELIYKILH